MAINQDISQLILTDLIVIRIESPDSSHKVIILIMIQRMQLSRYKNNYNELKFVSENVPCH